MTICYCSNTVRADGNYWIGIEVWLQSIVYHICLWANDPNIKWTVTTAETESLPAQKYIVFDIDRSIDQ